MRNTYAIPVAVFLGVMGRDQQPIYGEKPYVVQARNYREAERKVKKQLREERNRDATGH